MKRITACFLAMTEGNCIISPDNKWICPALNSLEINKDFMAKIGSPAAASVRLDGSWLE